MYEDEIDVILVNRIMQNISGKKLRKQKVVNTSDSLASCEYVLIPFDKEGIDDDYLTDGKTIFINRQLLRYPQNKSGSQSGVNYETDAHVIKILMQLNNLDKDVVIEEIKKINAANLSTFFLEVLNSSDKIEVLSQKELVQKLLDNTKKEGLSEQNILDLYFEDDSPLSFKYKTKNKEQINLVKNDILKNCKSMFSESMTKEERIDLIAQVLFDYTTGCVNKDTYFYIDFALGLNEVVESLSSVAGEDLTCKIDDKLMLKTEVKQEVLKKVSNSLKEIWTFPLKDVFVDCLSKVSMYRNIEVADRYNAVKANVERDLARVSEANSDILENTKKQYQFKRK